MWHVPAKVSRGLSLLAVIPLLPGCASLIPESRWKVDVVPADRPLIVSIATDRSASLWQIDPGEPVVLLSEPEARSGAIELIDPADCTLYDSARFQSGSFTIVLTKLEGPPVDYALRLQPGAAAAGQPSIDFTSNCTG
jgi:hypothetical protein